MQSWFRTRRALASSLAVSLVRGPATVIVTIILFGSNALPQSDSARLGMSANELARRVVTNELKFQNEDHAQWAYRQEKAESGKKQVSRIIETKDGDLSRLLSINDQPLAAEQLQKENQRVQELVRNPSRTTKIAADSKH
jgi:hypothetical protein